MPFKLEEILEDFEEAQGLGERLPLELQEPSVFAGKTWTSLALTSSAQRERRPRPPPLTYAERRARLTATIRTVRQKLAKPFVIVPLPVLQDICPGCGQDVEYRVGIDRPFLRNGSQHSTETCGKVYSPPWKGPRVVPVSRCGVISRSILDYVAENPGCTSHTVRHALGQSAACRLSTLATSGQLKRVKEPRWGLWRYYPVVLSQKESA